MKKYLLALILIAASPALAAPLFNNGTESFKIQSLKSETPVIRILDDSVMKRSFAMVANSVLGFAKSSTEPKPYVDLRLETLFLQPDTKNPETIHITLLISGKKFDLEPTLSRTALLSGKDISIRIPSNTHQLALFSVATQGQFQVRYNSAQSTLFIQHAKADINLTSPLSAQESETVSFVGKAIRINSISK